MESVAVERKWELVAQLYGLFVAAVLGYFLFGLTIQVSDSFGNLLAVQGPTLGQIMSDQFSQHGYLRPLLWAQIKIVYELANGDYFTWFRGLHVAQVVILIVLCVRLMRPRTALDAALVPLSLAVLVGAHTFVPALREAFPINSFLTVTICCAAAANISLNERPRWSTDLLGVLLCGVAILTVESGLLVWVIVTAAYLLDMRGISRRGVLVMTLCVVAYFLARMWVLDVGTPSLAERASGFGFTVLEPRQLQARFGERRWVFYAYNVVSSISTVLFSEPKGGVWRFIWEMTVGAAHPWTVVSVLSSSAATALVSWFLWSRRSRLRSWTLDHHERLVLLFVVVLVANAALSFPYTKNIIMNPAGVFLSLAVFAASRAWLTEQTRPLVVTVTLFAILTCGWAFRVAGTHYNLRRTAAEQRAEWVGVDGWLERQQMVLHGPSAIALRDTLRRDAIWNHPTPFQPTAVWTRWFDIDW